MAMRAPAAVIPFKSDRREVLARFMISCDILLQIS
jgi:hypothetical protein